MTSQKGKVRISLDFECGWGVAQDQGWRAVEASGIYRELRPAFRRFTKLLDELELSLTWAVVGGMIDEPSRRDVSHLCGRFSRDVKIFLTEAEDMTIDGRDLLDMVINMNTPQAFGTHTYSHLLFSDSEQSREVIVADLSRAISVNAGLGLNASRLVFPRNHAGHFEALGSLGITHVRMPPINGADPVQPPGILRRGVSLATRQITEVSEIVESSGVVLHHASELLNWGASSSFIKRNMTRMRRRRALSMAEQGADIHFWLHPFDLVQTKGLESDVSKMLFQISRLRDRGVIDIGGF